MTHLRGTQVILASQRLFEPMRKLCVIVDALHIAVSVIRLNRIEAKMGDYVANLAVQFPLEVRLGLLAPTTSIAWDRPVSGIDIGFFPVTHGPNYQATINSTADILMGLITPLFVDFYEHHRPWLRTKFGDLDKWPELFRFAWAIRNAISHHGGRLNITDAKLRPVVWHALSYDYRDAGTIVIGPVLMLADVVILMFEMAEDLDLLGCPV